MGADGTVSTIATGTIGLSSLGVPICLLYGHINLCGPQSVAADAAGNVYFADTFGNKVVRVSDGAAIAVNSPSSVTVDSAGNVYAVGSDKYVTKVNWSGANPDNDAQTFWTGFGVDPLRVTDAAGDIYTADTSHHQVTKTAAGTGVVTVFAGNGGQSFIPDGGGGYAVNAQLSPYAIAVDSQGNLFISIPATNEVRIVGKDGIIHTIASGLKPLGLTVDSSDNVYVLSSDNLVFKLAPEPAWPYISAVFDAASETATPISPGKIVAIYGAGIGPATGITATPSNGFFGTELAGTTVSINGVAAPIYYASSTQVNAIVPYATTGSTANITVGYNGTVTPVFTANVAVTAPGVFTYNASGSGEVAAINVSDGSLNTWASGAHWRFRRTLCDRRGADIAGGVPGAVAGLMQINAQIPKGVTPGGYVPVVVTIGDSSTVSDAVWVSVSN